MKKLAKVLVATSTLVFLSSCCSSGGVMRWTKKECRYAAEFAAGANSSNLSSQDELGYGGEDNSARLGAQISVKTFLPLNENLSVATGLGYSAKGSETGYGGSGDEFGGEDFSFEEKTRLSYLEFPVLAEYHFKNSGFNAFGGLQPALLLSAELETEQTGFESQSGDVKDQFKNLDVSAVLGVSYQFTNGLRLNASYDHGLNNIVADNIQGLGETRNRSFKISLGYLFSMPTKRLPQND